VPLTEEQQENLGRHKDEIDTPALLLDLDRFERNATKISTFLRDHGVGWRPHSKAHKSPQVARPPDAARRPRDHLRQVV
jgi:D-serine deaminase-like pyridoxal phosphate-dependent protein